MSRGLVLDACSALAMAFEDERDDYTRRVFASLAVEGAWVPALWPMEVVNILTRVGTQKPNRPRRQS